MTSTETGDVRARPAVDLLDPAFYLGDPHRAFTWMRTNEPVYRDETNDLWAVTKHADIRVVEGRADEFVSGQGYRSFYSPGETNMIAQDDPRHLEQRKLLSRRFTPKAVRDHEPWLEATIERLVDQMVATVRDGADGVEVVDALAAQLPGRLTASLLGWDEERWRNFISDPDVPEIFQAAGMDGMPKVAESLREHDAQLPSRIGSNSPAATKGVDDRQPISWDG